MVFVAPSSGVETRKTMQEALSTQAISVVCVFLFLTVAYYAMTSKVTAKASVLFTTTCAFGMLVGLLQSIGIIGMMTVNWPVDLNGFFAYFQVLLLDLDSFGFAPWRWTSPRVPLDVVRSCWQPRGLEDYPLRYLTKACFAGAKTDVRSFASVLFFPAAVGWLAVNHVPRPHPFFFLMWPARL